METYRKLKSPIALAATSLNNQNQSINKSFNQENENEQKLNEKQNPN